MPEAVKTILPHLSLLGILGEKFPYPHFSTNPFGEDRRSLSQDKKVIEKEIAETARRVRYVAQKYGCKDYSR